MKKYVWTIINGIIAFMIITYILDVISILTATNSPTDLMLVSIILLICVIVSCTTLIVFTIKENKK